MMGVEARGFALAFAALGLILSGVNAVNNGESIGSISVRIAEDGLTVSGQVFAASTSSLNIVDLVLSGVIGKEYFFAGSKSAGATSSSDSDVTVFANEYGETTVALEQYSTKSLVIPIPANDLVTSFIYFGIWDSKLKSFVAGVSISPTLAAPEPVRLGNFGPGGAHRVKSSDIIALDDKRIEINDFFYDGAGPDAFLLVGNGPSPHKEGIKVPDENGVVDRKLGPYNGKTIVVTLPEGVTVHSISWLSVYCITYSHNFNHINIADNLNTPPYLSYSTVKSRTMNCEALHPTLQVLWAVAGDSITFELAGQIDSGQWMGFGLSGSSTAPKMFGSDVVVADMQNGFTARAVDYHLTTQSQCANLGGACPDTAAAFNGTNDVSLLQAAQAGGVTRIKYSRLLNTSDVGTDMSYIPGTSQQVVWGIGPINEGRLAAKHTERITESKSIDFGRSISHNCPAFEERVVISLPVFPEQFISGASTTNFTVDIGNSGQEQGYLAITGKPSWGIAWWINGNIIPRLTLMRGVEYTFSVAGGRDPSSGMYHPFYITTDSTGGYEQKTQAEKLMFRVFAGVDSAGQPTNDSVGDFCAYELKVDQIGVDFYTYEAFRAAHEKVCQGSNRGELKWTPDENTPDTVYYQCYTHENLGFAIDVVDEFASGGNPATALSTALALFLGLLQLVFTL